jgi:hypothetical protein
MKLQHLAEPELEFAHGGRHVDIRYGLMTHGPLDRQEAGNPRRIKLGVIGTPDSVQGLVAWLGRCRAEIPAKECRYPNLFPRFPGFHAEHGFHAEIDCDARMQRKIPTREFVQLTKETDHNRMLEIAADLFVAEAQYLAQETGAEVVACAIPSELVRLIDRDGEQPRGDGPEPAEGRWQFHDVLKARGMVAGKPIQMIRPSTYGGAKTVKAAGKRAGRRAERGVQDEATRAWNIHTALYYKAKGVPWRLERLPTELTSCHVGVSFYKTLDRESVHTSVAQMFNQRGQGVIVRGGTARISSDDRTPHLSEADAYQLLLNALKTYRMEHRTNPARVVVHKTSWYDRDERAGLRAAVAEMGIEYADLLTVRESYTRLFRDNYYPPLRGTLLSLDDRAHVLYTRGSVEFFATYPGLYVPLPLELLCEDTEESPENLAKEVLALTKMNWNNTQFDGKWPITILAAKKVGSILRHLGVNDRCEPHYGFYM